MLPFLSYLKTFGKRGLDFDHIGVLFESKPSLKNLFSFLSDCKNEGMVIYSFPTNSVFDRFKVFLKIVDPSLSFLERKETFKQKEISKFCNIEDQASLFGENKTGVSLMSTSLTKMLHMGQSEFFAITETYKPISTNQNVSLNDLMVSFFEERPVQQRLFYLNAPVENRNYFKWDQSTDHLLYDQVTLGVLNKKNLMGLTLDDKVSINSVYFDEKH